MSKEDSFDDLKEAWSEFCSNVLAEKGARGVFKGANAVLYNVGEKFIELLEDSCSFDEDDEEDDDDGDEVTEND